MHAVIRVGRRGWNLSFDLSPNDRLNSHLPSPDMFDSRVEEAFARKWGTEDREGWRLIREGELLHCGQKVFVPDFVFRHTDGRTVLMEIIGFWTPEYLEAKFQTLRMFQDHRILLAVSESVRNSPPDVMREAVTYKSALLINDVLNRLTAPPSGRKSGSSGNNRT